MKKEKTYDTAKFIKLTGLTRQRLHQLRKGYKVRGNKYPAKLKETDDYYWQQGNIYYTEKALQKINSNKQTH